MSASFSPSEVIVRRKKFAIIAFLTIFVNSIGVYGGAGSDSWRLFARETNGMLEKCAQRMQGNDTTNAMWSCFKRHSLMVFDKITSTDVIPLTDNVRLVRGSKQSPAHADAMSQDDPVLSRIYQPSPMPYDNINVNRTVWVNHILRRSLDILGTHDIRLAFFNSAKNDVGEARRRNRFQMFPSMIFGMAVLGSIIIPLGFHFLTLLGGKAVFIAKMAFLVAIITSMKKLTTIGGHLGVYYPHGPVPPPFNPHLPPPPQWERS